MFVLLALVVVVLGGAFVAGALSRLTKPRAVVFAPQAPRRQSEVERRAFWARLEQPKVWDRDLVSVDVKAKPARSMGRWD
jgi:hypothetical protein